MDIGIEMRNPEIYVEKQGRPASNVALDMDRRKNVVSSSSSISLAYLSSVIITFEDTIVLRDGDIVYRS